MINGPVSPTKVGEVVAQFGASHDCGGHAIFLGQVRTDRLKGQKVRGIEYTAYEEMAEKAFDQIRHEAKARHGINHVLIWHSKGLVKVGEISLFVFISSGHREEAFRAIKDTVEAIKAKVPVWKKVLLEGGTHQWVDENQ